MIRKLLINTSSNVLVMIVRIVIMFVITPVIIHNLGNYDYGLWEMLTAVIGYMGLLDMGLKPTLSRFAAKHQAEQDRLSLIRVYSSGIFFMGGIGILLCIVFIVWGIVFPYTLAPDNSSVTPYSALLLIIAVQLLIRFPGFTAESFLEGFQKYYLKNNFTILHSVLGAVIIYIFITPDNGLVLLALVSSINMSLKYILFGCLLARESYGSLKPQWVHFNPSTLGKLMSFGIKSFIQGISKQVQEHTDTLIIGMILGPAIVPFYSIPANITRYLRDISQQLTHATMPLFSELNAKSEKGAIRQLYLLGSKYVVGVIIPMGAGICIVGGPFLGVWIGPEYQDKGGWVIFFLVLFSLTLALSSFSSRYLTALNKHGILAKYSPIVATSNIALSLLLIKPFGIEGVALASVIPNLAVVPVYLKYTCDELEIKVKRYFSESLYPTLLPTLFMLIGVGSIRYQWQLESYISIFATVLCGAFIYSLIFWLWSLKSDEKSFILQRITPRFS